jgi:hypothetical protein
MTRSIPLAVGILTAIGAQQSMAAQQPELVHVTNTFRLQLAASLDRVAPLFGPEGERAWAGEHWNPQFLYPAPAKDIQGAVFRIQRGQRTSVWVTTLFDLHAGRMQYVSFIDGVVVTTVDVNLTPADLSHTAVSVTYTRTALQPTANDDVRALGDKDRESGPEWQQAIEAFLNRPTK